MGEVRYACLVQSFPDETKKLHAQLEQEYKERWETYKQMAAGRVREQMGIPMGDALRIPLFAPAAS